jgi:hypothetical protein
MRESSGTATFNMKDDIGEADASIKVTSDVPVIPERSMYTKDPSGGYREGTCSIGTTAPAKDYYLAEGTTGWGFTTYVLVQNPNAAEANVQLVCDTQEGPVELPWFKMGPNTRKTVRLNDLLPGTDCSIEVHADSPIIAERSMLWSDARFAGQGMHDSIGTPAPQMTWYLPSGQLDGGETWVCVQNPNPGAVTVEVTYLRVAGSGSDNVTFTEEIPAGSRKTYNMAEKIPGVPAAVMVKSMDGARPIIVEGSSYFNGRMSGCNSIGMF